MAAPILPISAPVMPSLDGPSRPSAGGSGFGEVFNQAIQTVQGLNQEASESVERFLSGDGQELHSAILAVQRADLAFELGLQVRNKVVSAYQEIMRIQM